MALIIDAFVGGDSSDLLKMNISAFLMKITHNLGGDVHLSCVSAPAFTRQTKQIKHHSWLAVDRYSLI